jgi:FdhD protein
MSEIPRPERAAYRRVEVSYVDRDAPDRDQPSTDVAAVEEPLEIRLHGTAFATIMRTPGDDRALAAGFLLSESVVRSPADIGAVEHCRHPDQLPAHNVVDVYLVGDARGDMRRHLDERRNVLANSSCGLCGRVAIDSIALHARRLAPQWSMTKAIAAALPGVLRTQQTVFDGTGGLHAAGLFTPQGECVGSAEDVGRHNAVDKVIGRMLLDDRLPLSGYALAVSGRVSYEIVQKAWLAGIGLICAVSAPTTLAIDLADEAGITLLGFARGGGFNVYTYPERVTLT